MHNDLNDLQAAHRAAELYVVENLKELCHELIERDELGILRAGKVRHLATMLKHSGHVALVLAERLVQIEAVKQIANAPDKSVRIPHHETIFSQH